MRGREATCLWELVLDSEGRLQHIFCSDAVRAINRLVKEDVTQSRAEALFVESW